MEEDSTTTTLRSYKNDLDAGIANVMPDSWEGNARMAIRESDDVPESIEEKAIEKAVGLAEKNETTPEKAARLLIEKLASSE